MTVGDPCALGGGSGPAHACVPRGIAWRLGLRGEVASAYSGFLSGKLAWPRALSASLDILNIDPQASEHPIEMRA